MLLGRARELASIAAALAQARAGSSHVLAITGEAGIGKSSLLEWTAEQAAGMHVLRARGVESEAQIPFAGLFELLRPALDGLDRLSAPQRTALESALALRPPHAQDRFAVGAATLALLAAHAEAAPLAVLVDDVHWLDGSSADALRFALRRLVADPIAVVLTVREGQPSLLDGGDLPTHRLEGLDLEAAAALLRGVEPATTRETAVRLHRDTGGNPLALLELAAEPPPPTPLATPVPAVTSVAEAYRERIRGLPHGTRTMLLLAAASDLGDPRLLARAAATLGLDLDALVEAEDRGVVEIRSDRVELTHPLMRSAIYGGASPEQRRAAHRALADALPDAEIDRRAWHLALAAVGPDATACSALEQAGARARNRSAYDVASRAYERAALLAVDGERQASLALAAAETAWLAGQPRRAVALLDEAASHSPNDALELELEHLRGHIALRRGPVARGRAILEAAAERAADDATERAVIMLAEAAEGAFFAGDAAGMRSCGERAAELAAHSSGGRAAYFARMSAGMGRILTGDGEHGGALIREAVALLERTDDLGGDERLLAWAAMGPLWLREATIGDALVERATAAASAHSAAGALPHVLTHIGIQHAATGRFVDAQATLDNAIRLARETEQRTILAEALARLALVEARCGKFESCLDHAGEALSLARVLGAHLFEIWALTALGELDLVRGDVAGALGRFEEQAAALDRHGVADADLSPAPELVELYLRAGRRDDAHAAAGGFAAAAVAKGQSWALARAARCDGLLAAEDSFAGEFERALALHAKTPDTFETARTRLLYGSLLRRAGRRRDARRQLRVALTDFEGVGAQPWAETARLELLATGETARARNPSTLDDLTPQELNVSLLLARGRTTREAAAALFLSPKTIEYHLRNAYRKLGVHSREDLARALHGTRDSQG